MMDSKFLYFTKREIFDNIVSSFPEWLSPICFIEDSNEIWFNNHFFQAGHESLRVSEMNNTVTVSLSETSFRIVPGSSSIGVTASGSDIIVSCNALTKVDTEGPLEWKNNKLYHKESGITEGSYGQRTSSTGTASFTIPRITVDKYGHTSNIEEKEVSIRDYVEQRKSDDSDSDRPILLSERQEDQDDTNVTRKGKDLTYNNSSGLLSTKNLHVTGTEQDSLVVDNGNLIVVRGTIKGKLEGEVQGTATPKIHLSLNPDYGGASTQMFGHVKLVDEMPNEPQQSSNNQDKNNANVNALAASPYLVYNYVQASKPKINGINAQKKVVDLSSELNFTDDFLVTGNKLSLAWIEL